MVPTKDDFFSADPLPPERVALPAMRDGAEVFVRAMSTHEMNILQRKMVDDGEELKGKFDCAPFATMLVTFCAAKENGERIFGNEDVRKVAKLPASWTDPIVEAALRVNRMRKSDVEDDAENFTGANGRASSSTSRLPEDVPLPVC